MIDRQHGKIVFECDACSETLETETDDWSDANNQRKDCGWIAQQVGRDWVHFCSERCAHVP